MFVRGTQEHRYSGASGRESSGCSGFVYDRQDRLLYAAIAQLVEPPFCNRQVVGSNPTGGILDILTVRISGRFFALLGGESNDSERTAENAGCRSGAL